MSSHHIVRDEQEPAVLMAHPKAAHWLEGLLEWSPLFVVAQNCLPKILHQQIKIDAWLNIKDQPLRSEEALLLEAQQPLEKIDCTEGFWEAAMGYFKSKKVEAIHLLVEEGQFSWEQLAKVSAKLPLTVFLPKAKVVRVRGHQFQKWVKAGTWLAAWGKAPIEIKSNGNLPEGRAGKWVTEQSGMVAFESKQPFWVAEYLNGG